MLSTSYHLRAPYINNSTHRLQKILDRALYLQREEQRQVEFLKQMESKIQRIKEDKINNYFEPLNKRHFNYQTGFMIDKETFQSEIENMKFIPKRPIRFFSWTWTGYGTMKWCVNVSSLLGGAHDKTSTDPTVTMLIEQIWTDKFRAKDMSSNNNDNKVTNLEERMKRLIEFRKIQGKPLSPEHYKGLSEEQIRMIEESEGGSTVSHLSSSSSQQTLANKNHNHKRLYSEFIEGKRNFVSLLDIRNFFQHRHNELTELRERGASGASLVTPIFYSSRSAELILNCYYRSVKYNNNHHQNNKNDNNNYPNKSQEQMWATRALMSVISDCIALEIDYRQGLKDKLQQKQPRRTRNNNIASSSPLNDSEQEQSSALNLDRFLLKEGTSGKSIDESDDEKKYKNNNNSSTSSLSNQNLIMSSQRLLSWSDSYNISFLVTRCVTLLPKSAATIFDRETISFINQALLFAREGILSTKKALIIHHHLHQRQINPDDLRQKQTSLSSSSSEATTTRSSPFDESVPLSPRSKEILQENFVLPSTSIMSQQFPGLFNILEMLYRESTASTSSSSSLTQSSVINPNLISAKEKTRENVLILLEQAIEVIVMNYQKNNNSNISPHHQKMLPPPIILLERFNRKQLTQIVLSLGFMQLFSAELLSAFSPQIYTLEPRKGHHTEHVSLQVQQNQSSSNHHHHHRNQQNHPLQFTIHLPRFEAVIVSFVLGSCARLPFNAYDESDAMNKKRFDIQRNQVDPFFRAKVQALTNHIQVKIRAWEKSSNKDNNNNNNNNSNNSKNSSSTSSSSSQHQQPHKQTREGLVALAPKTEEIDVAFQFIQFFFKYYHGPEAEERIFATRRKGQSCVSDSIVGFSEETFASVFKLCNECLLPTLKAGANWLDLRDIARIATIGRDFANNKKKRTDNNSNQSTKEDESSNNHAKRINEFFETQLSVLEKRLASKLHHGVKKVLFETNTTKRLLKKFDNNNNTKKNTKKESCFPFAQSKELDIKLLLHISPVIARWICGSKLDAQEKTLSALVPLFVEQIDRVVNSSINDHQQYNEAALNCALGIATELLLSQPPSSKLYSSFINHEKIRNLITKQDEENLFALISTMKKKSAARKRQDDARQLLQQQQSLSSSENEIDEKTLEVDKNIGTNEEKNEVEEDESYMDII